MNWFNYYGLIFVGIMMIPNIVFALKVKDGFVNVWDNKVVRILEQIGRFGCFIFMVFNIPGTCFGWWINDALAVYLSVDFSLVALYCIIWIICRNKSGLFKSLALSIIPSVLFLFSGILIRSVLLLMAAAIFAPCHIIISYKNTKK